MARNGSGTYTIPTSFSSGTTILSADMNSNFSDVSSALTTSLATDGQSSMTGAFKAAVGSVSAPGITFGSETTGGFYRIGSNNWGAAANSTKIWEWDTTGLTVATGLALKIGSNAVYSATGTDVAVTDGGTGLSALTAHYVLIGNGTSALTLLAPNATSGIPLISQGASADPAYGTAVVAGGGTGIATATAYAVLCAGTTATGAFQSLGSVGTSRQALLSNGAAALPSFQTVIPAFATSTYTTNTDITTVIPYDDTIPQVTEGVQINSLSITATRSNSLILVQFSGFGSIASSAAHLAAALFLDGASNAVQATVFRPASVNQQEQLALAYSFAPGDTSAHTLTLRVGPGEAGTIRMNGDGANRAFGGAAACLLIAQEIYQ